MIKDESTSSVERVEQVKKVEMLRRFEYGLRIDHVIKYPYELNLYSVLIKFTAHLKKMFQEVIGR
jgi:hypothetical protein